MCILICRKDAQRIIVLVHRLAKVAPFLLVPPVAVRVAVLPFDGWRVDVAAILEEREILVTLLEEERMAVDSRRKLTMPGSSASGSVSDA